jgi:osmotically-inducible protein OsmY
VFGLLVSFFPVRAADKAGVSDDQIYDTVKRKLANDPDVKGGAVTVEVKDGIVTLKGTVESEKRKQKAEKLTRKVSGVKSVNNALTIAPVAQR